jgi:hypothetical protein
MNDPVRPMSTSVKWVLRVLGVVLPLASLLLLPKILFIVTTLRKGFSGKNALSNESMTSLYTALAADVTVIIVAVLIGTWLFRKASGKSGKPPPPPTENKDLVPVTTAIAKSAAPASSRRWSHCNVLQLSSESRQLWQFDGGSFGLNREQSSSASGSLPNNLVGKSWSSLWQRKLNVAWLPPENVFIRVAQFPASDVEETRAMVELQLEKLSPIPVTQAVWSMHRLPHSSSNLQTLIVTIVSRSAIEEFLGKLEGQGYLADRLELPLVDQLQATSPREDGAWIYPEAQGGRNTALVAWWYGGVLQSVGLLILPTDTDRSVSARDQLLQMAWAGELEGWLTSPPRWHLVADQSTAADWAEPLKKGLEQEVEVTSPLPSQELAARTARRAAKADPRTSLLPTDFSVRYRQQFVDRLWMRGLGALVGLYVLGLMVYFVALGVLNFKTNAVETQVRNMGASYTNALQVEARYKVLKERQELKYAALDCWEAVAETLPTSITLDAMNFSGGTKLALNGTAPADQVGAIIDFSDKLRKHVANGQPLFKPNAPPPRTQVIGGTTVRWSYDLELKRSGG